MPTTSVRRRISLLSRSCGLFDQICRQISRGKGGEGQQVVLGGVQVGCGLGELGLQSVQDVPHLGLDCICVGLFEDGP
jgi:succinyl-CoA synthetase alpha subunit